MQIHFLVVDALPKSFHEYVATPAPLAVHADLDTMVSQQTSTRKAGEPASLISGRCLFCYTGLSPLEQHPGKIRWSAYSTSASPASGGLPCSRYNGSIWRMSARSALDTGCGDSRLWNGTAPGCGIVEQLAVRGFGRSSCVPSKKVYPLSVVRS